MDKKKDIIINEKKYSFLPGTTIKEALSKSNEIFDETCIICKEINQIDGNKKDILRFNTTKGLIDIYLHDNELTNLFRTNINIFNDIEFGWKTTDIISFGKKEFPINKSRITKDSASFNNNDVFLFFAGFSPENCHVGFSKSKHEGIYGVYKGAEDYFLKEYKLGRVIRGSHIIEKFDRDDKIIGSSFIKNLENQYVILTESDLQDIIFDGLKLYTYLKAFLINDIGPHLDHLYTVIDDNRLEVSETSNSFILSEGISIPLEVNNPLFRKRGAITIRNSGINKGSIYIYKRNAPFSIQHSVVGEVVKGLQLLSCARKGDSVLIDIHPKRIELLGKTQKRAEKICSERNIEVKRTGNNDDNAIVIMHRPATTMDILYLGKVEVYAIDPNELIKIKLYKEKAPKSIRYFKEVADMIYYELGVLKISDKLSSFILLDHVSEPKISNKHLDAENCPESIVKQGEVGITNSLRKLRGTIGIRLKEDEQYGPTGENFMGTNIIGKILTPLEVIKNKKEGDLIYFVCI
ncbi:MAG: methanogenesis marker 3 protein [Candidatus Lokiarchaeota archaeon]|nr:methanogenesis marker 3 protein [Candidatus Lokiarchaeota archaeon]